MGVTYKAKNVADGRQLLAAMNAGGFAGTAQFASHEQLDEKEFARPHD